MAWDESYNDKFDLKYDTYGVMLYRLSMMYIGNNDDAEEIMQEAFLKLLYNAPDFVDDEHEKRWLIRITINLCKDRLKSHWFKKTCPYNDIDLFAQDETDIEMAQLILLLPPKYKDVIHLYYFENYSIKEIGQILHIGTSAVKMRLKRAKEFLRIELEEY